MPGNRNCFESNDATEAAPGLATAADGHNLFLRPVVPSARNREVTS